MSDSLHNESSDEILEILANAMVCAGSAVTEISERHRRVYQCLEELARRSNKMKVFTCHGSGKFVLAETLEEAAEKFARTDRIKAMQVFELEELQR